MDGLMGGPGPQPVRRVVLVVLALGVEEPLSLLCAHWKHMFGSHVPFEGSLYSQWNPQAYTLRVVGNVSEWCQAD